MRYSIAVPLFAFLAACSGQEHASVASPAATPELAVERPSAVKLPGKANFNIPSQLRSDKTYQTKAGATRRKVVYELLEATPDQADSAVGSVLEQAGYRLADRKEGKNGQFSIRYKKKKAATITVTYYPKLAKKPANPDAKSMVALSWQTKKAPKAKADVAGAASSK